MVFCYLEPLAFELIDTFFLHHYDSDTRHSWGIMVVSKVSCRPLPVIQGRACCCECEGSSVLSLLSWRSFGSTCLHWQTLWALQSVGMQHPVFGDRSLCLLSPMWMLLLLSSHNLINLSPLPLSVSKQRQPRDWFPYRSSFSSSSTVRTQDGPLSGFAHTRTR